MNEACNSKKKNGPALWGPGEGSKVQISLNFNNSQFQRFLYQTLRVFLQIKRYKTNISNGTFVLTPWSCPRGGTLGAAGVHTRLKTYYFFSKMVMWNIKLTGMLSRTECK